MADEFIPPRLSSSPPPFESDGFNDVDSVDSIEKDIASRPGFGGGFDLDNHEEFSQQPLSTSKPVIRNGFGSVTSTPGNDKPSSAAEKNSISTLSGDVERESIRHDVRLPNVRNLDAQFGPPGPSAASDPDVSAQEEPFVHVRVPGPTFDAYETQPTTVTDSPVSPPDDGSDFDNVASAVSAGTNRASHVISSADHRSMELPESAHNADYVLTHDAASERPDVTDPDDVDDNPPSLSDSPDVVTPTSYSSPLTTESNIPTGPQLKENAAGENSAEPSGDDEEFDEFSDWADPVGVNISPNDDGAATAVESIQGKKNDDEWAEFSDFSTSAPVVKTPPSRPAPQSPTDFHKAFTETTSIVFLEQIETGNSTIVGDTFDLDRGREADSSNVLRHSTSIWSSLRNLDETNALKFQWNSSKTRQALLHSLNLSYLSAKKDVVPLNNQRQTGGEILQPMKFDPVKSVVSNGDIHTPPLQENLRSETLNNQLLDFLGPASRRSQDLPLSPTSLTAASGAFSVLIPESIPPRTTPIPLPQRSKRDSSPPSKTSANGSAVKRKVDVDDVLARFRNLSFMQSKVLVAPSSASAVCENGLEKSC